MSYPLQNRLKTYHMTPEEEQVYLSLAPSYCFDPERTRITDFTPTRELYTLYRRYNRESEEAILQLTPVQFGVALRRTFGIDEDRKCRRWNGEKQEWGYCYVKGPASIVTRDGPGNPGVKRT